MSRRPVGLVPARPGRGDVHIDRLALRVAGLDEDAARALARLVAEGLAPGMLRPAGLAGLDSLRVEVQAGAADQGQPDLLARRIVDEIGRVLARDRVIGRSGRGGGPVSGLVLKGALVEFMPTFLPDPAAERDRLPVQPRDDDAHLDPARAGPPPPGPSTSNPLAVKGMPGEAFSFTIAMDANDEIADGSAPTAALAAGERDLQPARRAGDAALPDRRGPDRAARCGVGGCPVRPLRDQTSGTTRTVPQSVMPVTLFIWGAGRIVPVRVTGLTITEKLYDATLNPTHAEAQLSLRVLTPAELRSAKKDKDVLGNLATIAYDYTLGLRQALAVANLANAAESVIGMLPH